MLTLPSRLRAALLGCVLAFPITAGAVDDGLRTAVLLKHAYWVEPNVTYLKASGQELKLDVYRPTQPGAQAQPVVLHFHGGGWVAGSRESSAMAVLPWIQMGYTVVNVSYRLGNTALAPAAVEDTLCALQWVGRNAKKYNFDLAKVITTGDSAGGHLALATAMIPSDSPFTNQCAANDASWSGPYKNVAPKVAAVINWFGITDVAEMLEGPTVRSYAVAWFGSLPGREQLARSLSPLNHVRAGGPPVFTIHGDADPLVPYAHGVRLKAALDKAGVKNMLYTVKGGGHGGFGAEQQLAAYEAAREFLRGLGLLPARP